MDIKIVFLWKSTCKYKVYLRKSYSPSSFAISLLSTSLQKSHFQHLMIHCSVWNISYRSHWFLHLECPTLYCIYANSFLSGPNSTSYTKIFFLLQTKIYATCSKKSPTCLLVFQMPILAFIITAIMRKPEFIFIENIIPTRLRMNL